MNVLIADSIAQALEYKKNYPDYLFIHGGTDLMVRKKHDALSCSGLIDINSVAELKFVVRDGESVFIGAGSTHSELIADPIIQKEFPLLIDAVRTIGAVQMRNMGTLGGNIVNASPAGDSIPILYLLDANVVLKSLDSERELAIQEFIYGPGKTMLQPDEILLGVKIECRKNPEYQVFYKIGPRKAQAITKVSLSMMGDMIDGCWQGKIALGSVGPTIIRARKTEAFLAEKILSMKTIDEAAKILTSEFTPIDDVRSTAEYRKSTGCDLLKKAFVEWKLI